MRPDDVLFFGHLSVGIMIGALVSYWVSAEAAGVLALLFFVSVLGVVLLTDDDGADEVIGG